MFYIFILFLLFFIAIIVAILYLIIISLQEKNIKILPPTLTNNPSYDCILTQDTPLLSFFSSPSNIQNKQYEIQIDKQPHFQSKDKIIYIFSENNKLVSSKKIKSEDRLKDLQQYFWRVRTISHDKKSVWANSRFYVDTKADKKFTNLMRVPIKKVTSSDGFNVNNIIDYDDPGQLSFWQSPPPWEKEHEITFEFSKEKYIQRIWLLSNPDVSSRDGWLKDFVFMYSLDAKKWSKIDETDIKNNDTFRNIINFKPVKAKYIKLIIKNFIGYAAQINEIIFYEKGSLSHLKIPKQDYILIIGNEHNGFTFTDLAKHVQSIAPEYEVITVPFYEISLEKLNNLTKKPSAIILSGNNADYPNLPMFEYNGEFEIIRNTHIPILGICAGHQFLAMAYGYSRARSMGWSDISAIQSKKKITHINIVKNDPIFTEMKNNFTAPEVHSWSVVDPAEEFEVIAKSSYIQVQKSTKRLIYGIQFHAEINVEYNQAKTLISNFIKLIKNK